eukprot:Tamp_10741.p1 GENE.Tamp_10741~~Tamp_10741.p1  ORF type:complete len:453 (-),score=50.79 Tamp_10741:538-1896(-)
MGAFFNPQLVEPPKNDAAGELIRADVIERLLEQEVEAVHHCMLVSHETSDEMGCLLTLRAAPRSAGVALDHAGLQLASKSGSEAATVMSARQCALFRRGLALELEYLNHQIVHYKVQIRRFQVLREDLTRTNGMLLPSGLINRPAILRRYRHIINDMYHHDARYPSKWMRRQEETEGARGSERAAAAPSPRGDIYTSRSRPKRGGRNSPSLMPMGGARLSPRQHRPPSPPIRAPSPPPSSSLRDSQRGTRQDPVPSLAGYAAAEGYAGHAVFDASSPGFGASSALAPAARLGGQGLYGSHAGGQGLYASQGWPPDDRARRDAPEADANTAAQQRAMWQAQELSQVAADLQALDQKVADHMRQFAARDDGANAFYAPDSYSSHAHASGAGELYSSAHLSDAGRPLAVGLCVFGVYPCSRRPICSSPYFCDAAACSVCVCVCVCVCVFACVGRD